MFPPCPAPFNLTAYVLAAGQSVPDKAALEVVADGRSEIWRYEALRAAVFGTSTGLLGAGLTPGDRLLTYLSNSPLFPITYLGAIAAGIVPVIVSSQLTRGELAKIIDRCAPAAIASDDDGLDVPLKVLGGPTLRQFQTLPPAEPHMTDPDAPAYITFTSGTSGQPRGVVHAHRAIWARQMMWDGWYGLRPDDRMLHAGAMNWTFTLGTGLLDPWTIGATALIPAFGTHPRDLPALLDRHEATLFAGAPGVYRQMLTQTLPALPNLRHGLSAGEKLAEPLRMAWTAATGTQVHEAFGMSECSTFISGSPTRPAPPGTIGLPQPGRQISLRQGQIAVHGSDPGLMLGYLDDPAGTQAQFDDGWFLTGDMAEVDAQGAYRLLGRADDVMNAGGFRVSPLEVEAVLTQHPNLSEAAVCEVRASPDKTLMAAFYTGTATPEAELHSHCAGLLAKYKRPHLFIRLDTLPRGANNKLLRRHLRTQWETEHGQT